MLCMLKLNKKISYNFPILPWSYDLQQCSLELHYTKNDYVRYANHHPTATLQMHKYYWLQPGYLLLT